MATLAKVLKAIKKKNTSSFKAPNKAIKTLLMPKYNVKGIFLRHGLWDLDENFEGQSDRTKNYIKNLLK